MYEKLHFRRQFLLTTDPIMPFPNWNCLQTGQYYLYSHPDLAINHVVGPKKMIVLIGDLFDAEEPEKGNVDILKDILTSAYSMAGFVSRIKRYAGTYALLLKTDSNTVILQDARALREIYYCTGSNQIVCGSQPNLVAKFSDPEVKPTGDQDLLDFYANHLWDSRWIGDETYFEGVKHLLPNHYLDINKREVHRFWPDERIKRLSLEEAVSKSCIYLQGIMKAIAHRYQCMMAVTSGTDSRTLMAASKGIHEKIYYFVNNHGLSYNNPDISVPKKIFESIGVPFHVHDVPNDVDGEFRRIYLSNTFLASERILPSIYNVFFKNHEEKVLILGVGEIGRTFYGKEPKKLNSYRMAYKLGYNKCRYVIRQCDQIRAELLPVARNFDINVLALLYWEQRLGNWGGARNSESSIAIEKIDPYDSHLIYEYFLGVDEKYRSYKQNPCILFREMIRMMWPDLLEWPINPSYTMRDKIVGLLDEVGMFDLLKELKYQVNYVRYAYLSADK